MAGKLSLSPQVELPTADEKTRHGFAARPWQATWVAGSAVWIGVRTVAVSGLRWVPIPFIGYVREDVAAGFLAASAAACWTLSAFPIPLRVVAALAAPLLGSALPLGEKAQVALGVFAAGAVVPLILLALRARLRIIFTALLLCAPLVADPPRVYMQAPPPRPDQLQSEQGSLRVHVFSGLSKEESARIAAAAWDHRRLWTHYSNSVFLGDFGFGGSLNADWDDDPSAIPFWSLEYGFRSRLASESDFAWKCHEVACSASEERAELMTAVAQMPWFTESLRPLISTSLGVPPAQVVFGGEVPLRDRLPRRGAQARRGFGPPTVQAMLPSVFWHFVCNPHEDNVYYIPEIDGAPCAEDSLSTFLFPLASPRGAGLVSWTLDRASQRVREHATPYEVGKMYTFNASLPHAIRPFPYVEFSPAPRMTIQAFGVKCGEKWYVYH